MCFRTEKVNRMQHFVGYTVNFPEALQLVYHRHLFQIWPRQRFYLSSVESILNRIRCVSPAHIRPYSQILKCQRDATASRVQILNSDYGSSVK